MSLSIPSWQHVSKWHLTPWIQFKVKTGMDRTRHDTGQCPCPAPNSAGDGSKTILEGIRVTSNILRVNHNFRLLYGHGEISTLKVSYGLQSKINLKEEKMRFLCLYNKRKQALDCLWMCLTVASATPTTCGLTQRRGRTWGAFSLALLRIYK